MYGTYDVPYVQRTIVYNVTLSISYVGHNFAQGAPHTTCVGARIAASIWLTASIINLSASRVDSLWSLVFEFEDLHSYIVTEDLKFNKLDSLLVSLNWLNDRAPKSCKLMLKSVIGESIVLSGLVTNLIGLELTFWFSL